MNANPHDQRQLLKVAALDVRIAAAQGAAKNPPQAERVSALVAERASLTQQLREAEGRVDDIAIELARMEADVKVVDARIARDSERLAASSNAKQAQSLEHELAALERRKRDLEDAELVIMQRAEDAATVVTELTAQLEAINREGSELSAAAKAAVGAAQSEHEAASRDRAAVADTVPTALLAMYDKLAARSSGAALLRRRTCEGCHMVLAQSDLAAVTAASADTVVHCPECGCILVRTEESGL